MYTISNDRKIMGAMTNTFTRKIIAGVELPLIIGLAIQNGKTVFFKS
jgi:hypothetical protein